MHSIFGWLFLEPNIWNQFKLENVSYIITYVYEFGNTYYWGGINLTENKDGCFHTNELLNILTIFNFSMHIGMVEFGI